MGVLGFVARSDWRYLVAHAQEAGERGLEPGGPELGLSRGAIAPDAGSYYMAATEHGEPAGTWFGPGVGLLGYRDGQEVTAAAMEAVYGDLVHEKTGESLGSRPRRYATFDERLDKLIAAEGPDMSPEREDELRFAARKDQREACHYYDLTYSPEKSWSVLYAGLRSAGLDAEADVLWGCLVEGYRTGLSQAMGEACYARTGTHSGRVAGRTYGRWEKSEQWVATLWRHHTSRAGDPQLHIHGALLNRVQVLDADGRPVWYALDGTAVKNVRRSAAATVSRHSEALAAERLGISFVARPDGKGREIAGVDATLIEAFSSRRRAIEDKAAKIANAYRDAYQREPSAYELRLFNEQATLITRDRKPTHAPTGAELLAEWERAVRDGLGQDLADVPAAAHVRVLAAEPAAVDLAAGLELEVTAGLGPVGPAGQMPGPEWLEQVLGEGGRDLVIDQALADVGGRLTVWNRADVKAALDAHLPATLTGLPAAEQSRLLETLTDAALGHPDAVRLSLDPLIEAPQIWRRAGDGRGLHEPPAAYDRYAGAEMLAREAGLVEAATTPGYPGIAADAISARLEETTLRPAQRAAVERVLGSGRAVDVLIGPAGTGKSYTLGELARLWTENVAGADGTAPRVLGLATSDAAVRVLAGDGIDRHLNVAQFLWRHERVQAGDHVDPPTKDLVTLRAGDLIVLDEASMTPTADVERIVAAARAAGAKVVLAGDDRQLGAVEAGGAFGLLAERTRPVVLDEVVRFNNAWEGPASLRLREGDASVIREYDRRGRIVAGTAEELLGEARRGFVADYLTGRTSLVTTPSNEQAAELASHIRTDLVALGHVEADGVRLHNDTRAGVGDLVATRLGDHGLSDGCGGWVANRDTWRVTARNADGSLTVTRDLGADDTGTHRWGPAVTLPAAYVAEHVELAYAGTVHAAQGRTVDTCYSLVDPSMGTDALYVAATRAGERTMLLVPIEREPIDPLGAQDVDRPVSTPEAVLAQIIERPREHAAATQVLAAEIDARESLARLAPEWTDLITTDARARYTGRLAVLLGEDRWAELAKDPALGVLLRAVRGAEIAGRDVDELLTHAIGRRDLDDAESLAQVLHYRVTAETPALRGDGIGESGNSSLGQLTFVERTPALVDPALDAYARAIAAAMDERVQVLGERAAADPPAWAAALGPVPDDAAERLEWTRRAGIIAGHREQHGLTHPSEAIGPAPHRSATEDRAAWHAAWAALGRPDEARDLAAATRGELANTVQAWERAEALAPANVDAELRDAARTANFCDREARYLSAQARVSGQDPAVLNAQAQEFRQWETEARARVAVLEEAAAARQAWYEATAAQRRGAELASTELDRRAGRPDPAPAAVEPALVPAGGGSHEDREVARARQVQVREQLRAAWTEQARVSAELEKRAQGLEHSRASVAARAAQDVALAPFREQLEAARAAAQAAQAGAAAAQARLDAHAAAIRDELAQRWEHDRVAARDAARTFQAGTGRLGWGRGQVRDAGRHLDEWAAAWRPLVGALGDDTRGAAYYANRHPGNDRVGAAFDAHAKTQAERDLAEQVAVIRGAEDARQVAAEAARAHAEEATRQRGLWPAAGYGWTPEHLAPYEAAHAKAEQRLDQVNTRIHQLSTDPAVAALPNRDNWLVREHAMWSIDHTTAQIQQQQAAREAAERESSPSYDWHLDHDRGIDRGPSIGM